MPIPAETPLVVPQIPAVPERVFPSSWVSSLVVNAQSPTTGTARFDLLPFNETTGEILIGAEPEIIVVDLWQACSEIPEVAAAMAAVLAAVAPLRAWQAARRAAQMGE